RAFQIGDIDESTSNASMACDVVTEAAGGSGFRFNGGMRTFNESFEQNTFHIGTWQMTTTDTYGTASFWLDGTAGTQKAVGNPTGFSNLEDDGYTVGAGHGGGFQYLYGDIAEIILYDRVLTSAEMDAVNAYLEDKYDPSGSAQATNIAPSGTGVLGYGWLDDGSRGTDKAHAGAASNVNDNNLTTRSDTHSEGSATDGGFDWVGVIFGSPQSHINQINVTLATFGDGGWWGPNNSGPGVGNNLTAIYLTAPKVQVTTDGGTTWTDITGITDDYVSQLTGHGVGGGANPNPSTAPIATFSFASQNNINGIRLFGTGGGTSDASGTPGFLGVFEIAVIQIPGPTPANGTNYVKTDVVLSWPDSVASYNVYFGNAFNDVNVATTESTEYYGNQTETTFDPNIFDSGTYYWRIDDVNDANVASKGDVWNFTVGGPKATEPNPADNTFCISSGMSLRWLSGIDSDYSNVYIGTDFDEVNNAVTGVSLISDFDYSGLIDLEDLAVLLEQWLTDPDLAIPSANMDGDDIVNMTDYSTVAGQWGLNGVYRGNTADASFAPNAFLKPDIYYWRIDEVNEPGIVKGDVWKFLASNRWTSDVWGAGDYEELLDIDIITSPDEIRLLYDISAYKTNGYLISKPYNTKLDDVHYIQVSFDKEQVADTNIKIQIRTADTEASLSDVNFVGIDGTEVSFYTDPNGSDIPDTHDGQKWVQYKAILETTDVNKTPILDSVSIDYTFGQITTKSLVRDMVDLNHLAEFPETTYTSKQFSSYNRLSVEPNTPDWFANEDGTGTAPSPGFEEDLGGGEYLICDVNGPGAILRMWQAKVGDITGGTSGTIRAYIDYELFYEGSAAEFLKNPLAEAVQDAGINETLFEEAFVQCAMNFYFPIPFEKNCRIVWIGSPAAWHFYHVQVRTYPEGTNVRTFTAEDLTDYKDEIVSVAQVLSDPKNNWQYSSGSQTVDVNLTVDANQTEQILSLTGPAAIEKLTFKIDAADIEKALRETVLRISFDGYPDGQVQAPVGDFFGSASGINPMDTIPMIIEPDGTMT
ncbi:MAG: hypothetical protein DRP56_08645, partial [Planctomycetota bacterium]